MHNHTGCNDSAFLRCGFSYVSSMWLPERKLCTFLTFQSLDPSLVQISKREERDNCSIWTRLMYICNWPLVLSYSKLKEWKWNSSNVDGEGLLWGKHQVQEAGDQSVAAAIHLQHSKFMGKVLHIYGKTKVLHHIALWAKLLRKWEIGKHLKHHHLNHHRQLHDHLL